MTLALGTVPTASGAVPTVRRNASLFRAFWPALLYGLVVVGAAVILLVLYLDGALHALDRLVPIGAPFIPYFTT
jgi:hypothetical protein